MAIAYVWDTNILNAIDIQFLNAFKESSHHIAQAGESLAFALALISLGLSVGMMILRGEETHAMVSKCMQICLMFGLFFGLIEYGGIWIPQFLNGFIFVGQQASGLQSVDPSSVFNQGWYIASQLVTGAMDAGMFHVGTAIMMIFAGFFIIIIYALISASLCVLYVKAYALVLVGPLVFALGNNDVTRSSVHNYVQKIIGMGFNLLFYYIIIGVGVKIGDQWTEALRNSGLVDFSIIAMIFGGLIVFYLVLQNVPSFIATISGATGFRDYGQAAVASAMTASAMMTSNITKAMKLGGAGIGAAGSVARGVGSMMGPTSSGAQMGYGAAGKAGSWAASKVGLSPGGSGGQSGGMPGMQSAATTKTGKLFSAVKSGAVTGVKAGLKGGIGGSLGATTGAHAVKPMANKAIDRFKGNK
jgi:type IV secretion system protein TrbL